MNTQIASFLQGTAVGALVTLLATKVRRGMALRKEHLADYQDEALSMRCDNIRRIMSVGIWNGTPVRFSEGSTIRGNGNSGPSTPKPPISPTPAQFKPFSSVEPLLNSLVDPEVEATIRRIALRRATLRAWEAERQFCIDLGYNPPPKP